MVVLVKPAELVLLSALVAARLLGANGVACRHLSVRCADPRCPRSRFVVEMRRFLPRFSRAAVDFNPWPMAVFHSPGLTNIALADAFPSGQHWPTPSCKYAIET